MKQILFEGILISLAALLVMISFPVGEATASVVPDCPWEVCIFIALAIIFYIQRDKDYRSVFMIGYLFGFLYNFGTLSWVVITMLNYGNLSAFLSYFLLCALVCYVALYTGLFFLFTRLLTDRLRLPTTLVGPAVWVLLEYIRSYFITGFPWNLWGYTLYRHLLLVQIADIVGVYGLSFVIVALNCLVFDLFFRDYSRRMKLSLLVGTATLVVLTIVYGRIKMDEPLPTGPLNVCLVQGNYRQEEKWEPGMKQTTLDTYEQLTRSTFSSRPTVIVWPEAALPFRLRYSGLALNSVAMLARDCRCSLVIGTPDMAEDEAGKRHFYNSAFLITPQGKMEERYDKIHLVPFGEYVPLTRFLFFVEKMTEGATGDFSSGQRYTVFRGDFPPFSVYICYETIFPDLVRKFSAAGARWLVTITNDAWFDRSAASYQHFAMTVLRAVENRCPVVRAANTGITGIIDQKGRVLDKTELFVRTTLCGTITARDPQTTTFYIRWGDLFAALCSLYVLCAACLCLMKR